VRGIQKAVIPASWSCYSRTPGQDKLFIAQNTFAFTANANPLERPSVGLLHSGIFHFFQVLKETNLRGVLG